MKRKIKFGNATISYTLVKSNRRKTSQITVDKDNVVVRTPFVKSQSEIREIVKAKAKWIFKKQLQFKQRPTKKQNLRRHSAQFLRNRVKFHSQKMNLYPKKVNIKKLKSRWGSATNDGTINLNVNLLNAPKKIIDYIVIHELCHLKIKGHSRQYWNLLHKFMPDYEKNRHWLEINHELA